jgi:hypothetical protein
MCFIFAVQMPENEKDVKQHLPVEDDKGELLQGLECFHCDGHDDVEQRLFHWKYRPRHKYIARGRIGNENDILEVELCSSCYSIVDGMVLIGSDWWDAYNTIDWTLRWDRLGESKRENDMKTK